MSRLIDLTNRKFNRLTVIERDTEYEKTIKNKISYWKCKCDCGNYKTVSSSHLRKGDVKSCGCYNLELLHNRKKHNIYIFEEKYIIGNTRKGDTFYIDYEDYNKVKDYCWRLDKNRYVVTTINGNKILLHRFILNVTDNKVVDHINHKTWDNRRNNLRVCFISDNLCNMKTHSNNTSGYRGVSKYNNGWCAELRRNKARYRKYFKTKEEAIIYRKELENKYQKEFKYGGA